jgi:biopolymer transport protein ExbD
MPSVKLPRKSTDTDMTPFVDVAFLILSFFMLATKFKPPEPVPITTPGSVLSQKLPETNAVMITVDSSDRVFFSVLSDKDMSKFDAIIQGVNSSRNLGLTPAEMANYRKTFMVGVPFGGLKQLLDLDEKEQQNLKQQ